MNKKDNLTLNKLIKQSIEKVRMRSKELKENELNSKVETA